MSIDAVITWVDGQDAAHLEKQQRYLKHAKDRPSQAMVAERLHSSFELEFCLKSIFKYIPWIRTVYIVTDAQIPDALARFDGQPEQQKLQIVDHLEIFKGYESALPTFNSIAIESLLWRIPNLSEQFIYFNDDCFLTKPMLPTDFFVGNRIVVRGQYKLQYRSPFWPRFKAISDHRQVQENGAQCAGWWHRFLDLPHMPFALNQTIFKHYFEQNPAQLQANIQHAFRQPEQFWPISLFYHLLLLSRNMIWDNQSRAVNLNGTHHGLHKIQHKLKQIETNPQVAFLCIQNLCQSTPKTQQMLLDWLSYRMEQDI